MAAEGIEVRWTDVGDRYVMEEMRGNGFTLGGEQSGHLIDLSHGPSGDGLAAGLHLLRALRERGEDLRTAAAIVQRLPQRLVNVTVARKQNLPDAAPVWDAVRRAEAALGEDGRVVVRSSGTEPLVRVMVEAPTVQDCDRWCREISLEVEKALGGSLA
jgi:phosphoglucosamine mutase